MALLGKLNPDQISCSEKAMSGNTQKKMCLDRQHPAEAPIKQCQATHRRKGDWIADTTFFKTHQELGSRGSRFKTWGHEERATEPETAHAFLTLGYDNIASLPVRASRGPIVTNRLP